MNEKPSRENNHYPGNTNRLTLTIGPDDAGIRLDSFIRKVLPDFSLSLIYKWIRTKEVKVNNEKKKHHYRLELNDVISIFLPRPKHGEKKDVLTLPAQEDPSGSGRIRHSPEPDWIIHEDSSILVVNKPADLPVHGGSKIREMHLTDMVREYCQDQISTSHIYTVSPVHRLDRETSGIIVFARQRQIHKELCLQIKDRLWEKTYLCLIEGRFPDFQREFHEPLAQKENPTMKQPADTFAKTIATGKQTSLLEITIDSGRFRQIRRHLSRAGFRICGEKRYAVPGRKNTAQQSCPAYSRLYLHAWKLSFLHPEGKSVTFTAPLPTDFIHLMNDENYSLHARDKKS